MGITNIITLLKNKLIPFEDAILFTCLAAFGGAVITSLGTIIIKKYKIAYVPIFIVFFLGASNIVSSVWYVIIESKRFGFNT